MGTFKTPLRYPGGKQKIWAFIAEIIEANGLAGGHYVEPYAGGAGVAMELLLNGIVSTVHLNDSCPAVYAFWYSVINSSDELCRRISRASLTIEEWKKHRDIFRNPGKVDRIDLGYAMLYLNRCNRSGILSGGVIGGMKQSGEWKMDARFSRKEIIRRIETIASRKGDIKLRNWDAERFLLQYTKKLPGKTLIYCDPPYFKKADRLYANYYTPDDHARLAETIQRQIPGLWVVSYDNAPEILRLYNNRKRIIYFLQYNAAKAYKGSEVIVLSDKLELPSRSQITYINDALCSIVA